MLILFETVFIFPPNFDETTGQQFAYRIKTIGLNMILTNLVRIYLRKSNELYKISLGKRNIFKEFTYSTNSFVETL